MDDKRLWNRLKEKKGSDASTLVRILQDAVDTANMIELGDFLTYLASRSRKLIDPLAPELQTLMQRELDQLRKDGCFILSQGEIEDYLPPGARSLKSIVTLTSNRNWINSVPEADRRVELGKIVCAILELT